MTENDTAAADTEYSIKIEGFDFGYLYGTRASKFSNKTMLTLYGYHQDADAETRAEIDIRQAIFGDTSHPEDSAPATADPGIIGFVYFQQDGRVLKIEISLRESNISSIANALFSKRQFSLRVFAGETYGGPWSLDWPYAEVHAIWFQSFELNE